VAGFKAMFSTPGPPALIGQISHLAQRGKLNQWMRAAWAALQAGNWLGFREAFEDLFLHLLTVGHSLACFLAPRSAAVT